MPSPSYFDVVYLNPDRQAVVPCRVTVLSAKVTLHREFPAKEIPANGTDIVYDMKRGFVYLQPHSEHQGVVYCRAEARGRSQISVKYQLLYVAGKPGHPCLDSSHSAGQFQVLLFPACRWNKEAPWVPFVTLLLGLGFFFFPFFLKQCPFLLTRLECSGTTIFLLQH